MAQHGAAGMPQRMLVPSPSAMMIQCATLGQQDTRLAVFLSSFRRFTLEQVRCLRQ